MQRYNIHHNLFEDFFDNMTEEDKDSLYSSSSFDTLDSNEVNIETVRTDYPSLMSFECHIQLHQQNTSGDRKRKFKNDIKKLNQLLKTLKFVKKHAITFLYYISSRNSNVNYNDMDRITMDYLFEHIDDIFKVSDKGYFYLSLILNIHIQGNEDCSFKTFCEDFYKLYKYFICNATFFDSIFKVYNTSDNTHSKIYCNSSDYYRILDIAEVYKYICKSYLSTEEYNDMIEPYRKNYFPIDKSNILANALVRMNNYDVFNNFDTFVHGFYYTFYGSMLMIYINIKIEPKRTKKTDRNTVEFITEEVIPYIMRNNPYKDLDKTIIFNITNCEDMTFVEFKKNRIDCEYND